jgi:AmmeMemoRadiSam system protein A
MLSADERRFLLDLAESTLRQYLASGTRPEPSVPFPSLLSPCGAFVTLHVGKRLRGCIGSVEARRPLWQTVRDMAVEAAVDDPRFSPMSHAELAGADLEISVLTPPAPLAHIDDLEIGRDGLIVRHQGRSGLLLPQVAVEWGFDRQRFLEQTCIKAGLPQDAWRAGATLLRFSAEVFGRALGSGQVEDRDPAR